MIARLVLDLSVVVVVHDMAREAPRALRSLSASYQRGIDASDYEVIVVDNGSDPPLDPRVLADLGPAFRLVRIDDASPSPAAAVNRGLAEARGEIVGVIADGARIATPGLLHFGRHGARLHPHAVVAALGWYLGGDLQVFAPTEQYDRAREDALLDAIRWPDDGYRLFEIATFDESSTDGWFSPISESSALFMRREAWARLGGLDERFTSPGGGLANPDLFRRALETPGASLVVLLAEATFHQLHGGAATNAPLTEVADNHRRWSAEYHEIRGRHYAPPALATPPTYLGVLPPAALARFVRSALRPVPTGAPPPLGQGFDPARWTAAPQATATPILADVIAIAQAELAAGREAAAAAVARLGRGLAPDDPEARRITSLAGPWLSPMTSRATSRQPAVFLAVARALGRAGDRAGALEALEGAIAAASTPAARADMLILRAHAERDMGQTDRAIVSTAAALGLNYEVQSGQFTMARLLLPGEPYDALLPRIHELLRPRSYLEIGVDTGTSIALARPPTVAVGIDPTPRVTTAPVATTKIFPLRSDEYFATRDVRRDIEADAIDLGFVDGLHVFEQALRDFANVERHAARGSVILIHDTLPFDARVATRDRNTAFWTGDVWKVIPALREARPDLSIFTVAAPPSGLTIVTNLDPSSTVLRDRHDEIVARHRSAELELDWARRREALLVTPNDWRDVERRLSERAR